MSSRNGLYNNVMTDKSKKAKRAPIEFPIGGLGAAFHTFSTEVAPPFPRILREGGPLPQIVRPDIWDI